MALALSLQEEEGRVSTIQQPPYRGGHDMLPVSVSGQHHQPSHPHHHHDVMIVVEDVPPPGPKGGSHSWGWDNSGGGGVTRWGRTSRYRDYEVPDHDRDPHIDSRVVPPAVTGRGQAADDWNFARTLQMLEFEMNDETAEVRREMELHGDFEEKEYNASSCQKQMLTVSTLICVVQIIIFIVMLETGAKDPNNAMVGPDVETLIRFGAKDAALIIYKGEWWRLFTPILLHGSVLHLAGNVLIQLRIGGYLELVFTTPKWIAVYLSSGVFGNICSCLFLPDAASVGSSGAVLGLLTSWMVWILFRWKKIPHEAKSQRNCQMTVVVVSIGITLAFSFTPAVDWAAHFGGVVMGLLSSVILVANELDNEVNRAILRISSLVVTLVLFIVTLWYMTEELKPSDDHLQYY